MKKNKTLLVLIGAALLMKLALFGYASVKAPGAKFLPDTHHYLETGMTLVDTGTFGRPMPSGGITIEMFRTPGYPLFLGVLHGIARIPLDGIIFIQIVLTIVAAYIVYAAARHVDQRLAVLSGAIMLFDLPITIFSLILLTETLCMVLMALLLYWLVRYIATRKLPYLIGAAVSLALATYVRPITYYLPIGLALCIGYMRWRVSIKKAIAHVLVFLLCAYGLLGIWQWRNFYHTKHAAFSTIEQSSLHLSGLYKSYEHNTDPYTQNMQPLPYYLNTGARCLASLMTRPGTLKYFGSPTIKAIGKVVGYPWVGFWLIGFLVGITRLRSNSAIQCASIIIAYCIVASISGGGWGISSRFRVVMMPCIALVSSYGWQHLISIIRRSSGTPTPQIPP